MIPYSAKELLLFAHIYSGKEENCETILDHDTTDMIQKDPYTSYDSFDFHDNVFHDDPFCNIDDDQSILFDIEIYKSTKLDDKSYHISQSESDFETLPYKPRSLKF